MSDRLQRWIDNLLTTLDTSVGEDRATATVPLSAFTPVEPLIALDLHEELVPGYDRNFFPDVTPMDLNGWDISILSPPKPENEDIIRFCLTRFRNLDLKLLRGTAIKSSHIGEISFAILYKNGKYISTSRRLNYVNNHWLELCPYGGKAILPDEEVATNATMALGVAFTRHYEWTVSISQPGKLGLLFVTDPIGAREVFKLRDLPVNHDRRAALRHWVTRHWRQKRTEKVPVREHLRGVETFVWKDLVCEIKPSTYDLFRADLAKKEATKARNTMRKHAVARYGKVAENWQ